MIVAFYAPMKSPYHAKPSGDRQIAKLIIQALENIGHTVTLASQFRSWEGRGEAEEQEKIKGRALKEVERLCQYYTSLPLMERPRLWITYHLYHKAPDWLGYHVSQILKIPYFVIEASYADKQKNGLWTDWLSDTKEQIRQAHKIFCFHENDKKGLIRIVKSKKSLVSIKPFIDVGSFQYDHQKKIAQRNVLSEQYHINPKKIWICTSAMMREGDKYESYHVLSHVMQNMRLAAPHTPFHHLIAGGGCMVEEVKQKFDPSTTCFVGILDSKAMRDFYNASDIFVWPAINEAVGFSVLESQAAGLPAVVGSFGALNQIIHHQKSGFIFPADNRDMFIDNLSNSLCTLINDKDLRKTMGNYAQHYSQENYSLQSFEKQLKAEIQPFLFAVDSKPKAQ